MSRLMKFRSWLNGSYKYFDLANMERFPLDDVTEYSGTIDYTGNEIYEHDFLINEDKDILFCIFQNGQFLFRHINGSLKGYEFARYAIGTGSNLKIIGCKNTRSDLMKEDLWDEIL